MTLSSVHGCDSIVTTNLTVNPVYDIQEEIQICDGESYNGWTQSGTHRRTLTSVNGCDSIVTTNLTVNPVYDIQEDIQICEGENYNGWTQTGTHQRTLTSVNGCDSMVITNLTVFNSPTIPEISVNSDTLRVTQSYEYYQWFCNNEILENQINQKCIVEKTGNYKVKVINENGCFTESGTINIIFSPVLDFQNNMEISIFPNPNTGKFTLKIENIKEPFVQIEIFSSSGILILTKTISSSGNKFNEIIDIKEVSKGQYHLRVIAESYVLNKKIIVM